MRNVLISVAAAAAIMSFVPASSQAQGIGVETPLGGVRIGEPGYRHYYRDEGPVVERRVYRERDVRLGCRTVTIRSDDGYVKRIRKCD
jgi:hypothetical protein